MTTVFNNVGSSVIYTVAGKKLPYGEKIAFIGVGDKFEILKTVLSVTDFLHRKTHQHNCKLHKVVTNIIINVTICYRENLKDPHFLTLIFSLYRISNEMN